MTPIQLSWNILPMMVGYRKHDMCSSRAALKGSTRTSRRQRLTSRRTRTKQATIEILDDHLAAASFDHFELKADQVYLHSDFLLCPGDEVLLHISLSTCREPLNAIGVVVRAETGDDGLRPGMAVSFTEMKDSDRHELKRFLSRRY
ncbi:MAG: hypothetical protein GY847_04485 [Proteobacteria bacterium]|nr:hypothetical protein [Pseudomonadota bacterium]